MTTRQYVPAKVEAYNDKSTTNIIEHSTRPQTVAAVGAQWLHNAGGGLGAAIVWVAASFAVHGAAYWVWSGVGGGVGPEIGPWPNPVRVGVAAFVVGCVVFGLLMALRASLDEIVQAGEWNSLQAEYDALELEHTDSMAMWESKYQMLRQEHNLLQAEHKLLLQRKGGPLYGTPDKIVNVAPEPVLPQKGSALSDAIELMQRAYHNQPWSRDVMIDRRRLGDSAWSKQRWMDARQWLLDSKVLYYDGEKGNVPKWTYPDNADAALLAVQSKTVDRHAVMSS